MSAPDGVEDLLERLRRTSEELDAMAATQQAEWDQARAGWAAEDAERAKLARRGDLGPQWQKLQGRIDLEETSTSAIVRGLDDSPEAESVRAQAEVRAGELRAELEELDAQGEAPVLRAERTEMAELQAALDDLRRFAAPPPPSSPA